VKKVLMSALAMTAAALVVAAPVWANDFSQGQGVNAAANWKVYGINPSGMAYGSSKVASSSDGVGFDFQAMPDTNSTGTGTSLLMTTHPGGLLGDLSGKTVSATFTVTGTNPVFTYYGDGQPWNSCGTPASVRLYFEGNTNGPFAYSKYWWSNPGSATLASVVGNTVTLSVPLDASEWSNWGGQLGSSIPGQFNAAAADVSGIGLSFGGGCFFANGVGLASGSASFQLKSYSVS
jgi:hypothetical protein